MRGIESVNALKQTLFESLGENCKEYRILMNKWFRMQLTRQEFENEVRKYLNDAQLLLHNQLMLKVLKNCASITNTTNESKPKWNRCSSYISNSFEPIDPIFYEVTERQEVNTDLPSFILQDRLLPDGPSMVSRTTYAAWEHGLESTGPGVAELLATATNQFLRNIIVAIIRKRKGCCFKNNGFVYSLGTPSINPWLNNVSKQNNNNNKEFHSLRLDPNAEGLLTPASRISREELYHRQLFSFASSDAPNITLAPISVNDLIYTLQLHPSLIASYFTKTVNIERMIARVNYPSDD